MILRKTQLSLHVISKMSQVTQFEADQELFGHNLIQRFPTAG